MLLVQKSILRDAYNDLSIHFLAKVCLLVVCASSFLCPGLGRAPTAGVAAKLVLCPPDAAGFASFGCTGHRGEGIIG